MIFIRRNDPSRFSRNTKKSQKWLIRKIAATNVLIPNCPVKMFNTLVSWSNFLYSYKCNCPKLLWNVTKIRDIKVNPNCSNMCCFSCLLQISCLLVRVIFRLQGPTCQLAEDQYFQHLLVNMKCKCQTIQKNSDFFSFCNMWLCP